MDPRGMINLFLRSGWRTLADPGGSFELEELFLPTSNLELS